MVRLLADRGLTLALAESSSGGLIGHLITDVPGSSAVFLGGVIAYHNRVKELLGVPAGLIEAEGAVSAPVAEAMASAVRHWAAADVGLAVTGIAGPGGGTAAKPVGLTYTAVATAAGALSGRHVFAGERSHVKLAAAEAALALVLDCLERGP